MIDLTEEQRAAAAAATLAHPNRPTELVCWTARNEERVIWDGDGYITTMGSNRVGMAEVWGDAYAAAGADVGDVLLIVYGTERVPEACLSIVVVR